MQLTTLRRIELDGRGIGQIWGDSSLNDVTRSLEGVWRYLKPPQGDYIGVACSFWFTEEGWDAVGEVTYVRLQRALGDERVKLRVHGYGGPVIYQDEHQVCISDRETSQFFA